MDAKVTALLEGAKMVSIGMIQVAATKPNDTPLQSNAETFRGAANMLSALSQEVARGQQQAEEYRAKLDRIANLKVRGATEAIEQGNWKAIAEELQAIAQEAITPGSGAKISRGPRS